MELYYSLRSADVRRSSRRRRFVVVTARGSGLAAVAGALIGAVVGAVLAPLVGALFGLVLGAAAGFAVGLPAAMTLAATTRSHAGRLRLRVVGALASAGWALVLVAVPGAGGSDIGAANYAALSAIVVLIFATIGASIAPVAAGASGAAGASDGAGGAGAPAGPGSSAGTGGTDSFGPVIVPSARVQPIRSFDPA